MRSRGLPSGTAIITCETGAAGRPPWDRGSGTDWLGNATTCPRRTFVGRGGARVDPAGSLRSRCHRGAGDAPPGHRRRPRRAGGDGAAWSNGLARHARRFGRSGSSDCSGPRAGSRYARRWDGKRAPRCRPCVRCRKPHWASTRAYCVRPPFRAAEAAPRVLHGSGTMRSRQPIGCVALTS